MKLDRFFSEPLNKINPFKFDAGVADVFDDMLARSIPFYEDIHKLIIDVTNYTFHDDDLIYDLGCSTGSTIKILSHFLTHKKARFIGVDNSLPMLEKAGDKLKGLEHPVQLRCDHLQHIHFQSCGMVIMNYTLQFIPVEERQELVSKVYQALRPGGVFIMAEKIESPNKDIQNLTTDLYYDFKRRNGYSELEIAQKREALEEVLITLPPEKQVELMKQAGFQKSEMIFRWYNFACFLGIK
jgi:tRNA (cmo5U34)-methyltransferase